MNDNALKTIKLVVLDVDGVLTDGTIVVDDHGVETKVFHVQDGSAMKWLLRSGIPICIMSGRRSAVVDHRCEELGIEQVHQKILDKGAKIEQVARETGVPLTAMAFVGDDLFDLPAMRKVGFAVAVANARDEVKEMADYVTTAPGGRGAVREFIERLMKANGSWNAIIEKYLS